MSEIKKVVIFAGGTGTRLGELTQLMPKPLVPVGGDPIVVHIMRHFYRAGYREFILAVGYKSDEFKKYFRDYGFRGRSVSFSPFGTKVHECTEAEDWTIHVVETGPDATTGQRLHKVREYIGDEDFFLTYGDSHSDVDLAAVAAQHSASGKLATITAVPITERFGILGVDGEGGVHTFAEKSDNATSLINGGFIACSNRLLDWVHGDSKDFSFEALTKLANDGKLGYFRHDGFWHAMDTKKDHDDLEELYESRPELFGRV